MRSLFILFAGLFSMAALAATVDASKLVSLAEVQKYVSGSTLKVNQEKGGKLVFADQKWSTMPLVTIDVSAEKDVAGELKRKVKMAGMFGLAPKPVNGVGDEAFHDEQFNTLYFRKAGKIATIGAAKDAGQIKVQLFEIAKLLASRM